MKKILITLSIVSGILLAGPIHNLMDNRIKGESYSGNKGDYEASKDGLGIVPLQHHSGTRLINDEIKIQKLLNKIKLKTINKENLSNIKNSINSNIIGTIEEKEELKSFGFDFGIEDLSSYLENSKMSNEQGTWGWKQWGDTGLGWWGAGLCSSDNGIVDRPKVFNFNFKSELNLNKLKFHQNTHNNRSQLKRIKVEASKDNINWNLLFDKDNLEKYIGTITFNFNNKKSYKYYRVLGVDTYHKGSTSAGYCQANLFAELLD